MCLSVWRERPYHMSSCWYVSVCVGRETLPHVIMLICGCLCGERDLTTCHHVDMCLCGERDLTTCHHVDMWLSVWRERPYHMSSCWYVSVCVERDLTTCHHVDMCLSVWRETLPHVIMLICVCLCGERDLTTCHHVDMWLSVWRERPYHMSSCWYVAVCVERDLTTCHHVDMWLSVWGERPYHMSSCWYVVVCVERETLPHVIMLICGCLCGERDLTTCHHVDMWLSVWRERPYHMSSCWYVSVCVERETLPHVIMLICVCLCGERDLTTCHHVDMCLSVWRERPYHMSSCWYVAVCVERETLPHVIMLICGCLCGERDLTTCYHVDMVCLCGERDLTTCHHVDMCLSVWGERPYHMLSCWYVSVCVWRETLPHVIMLICGCLCGERDLTTCHHVDMCLCGERDLTTCHHVDMWLSVWRETLPHVIMLICGCLCGERDLTTCHHVDMCLSVWRERPYHMSSCWYVAVCVERETLPHVIMLICVCLCGERDLTTCHHVDMCLSVWRERPYHMSSCWYVAVCVERDLTTCHHVDMWLSVWGERPYHMSSCWYVAVCVGRETLPHVIMLICGCLCGERPYHMSSCWYVAVCVGRETLPHVIMLICGCMCGERPYHMSSCWYVAVCVERETVPHVIMLICGCLCGERDLTTCHHVDMWLSVWRETLPHVIMLICGCLCGERDLTTCHHVDMWLSVWGERPYHMSSCWYVAVCVGRETLPHVIMLICGCLCGERPYHMSSCWYVAVCVGRETLPHVIMLICVCVGRETLPHVIMLICVCLCGERDLTTCHHVDMWLSVWGERPYHMSSCWYVAVCVERETLPHVIMLICGCLCGERDLTTCHHVDMCLCGERDLTTCHHVDMWLSVWRERPYHMSSCWYVSVCVERETLPHVIMLICVCLCGERDLTTCHHVDMWLSVWRERPYHMSSCWYVAVCVERETLPHVIMLICGCLCGERDLTTCHHVDMWLSVWRERPYHMSSCWSVSVCVERDLTTCYHVDMWLSVWRERPYHMSSCWSVSVCVERDLTTCHHVDMWLSVWRERPYHMSSCWYVAVCVERDLTTCHHVDMWLSVWRETLPHVIMLICGCLCGERDLTTCHHVDMWLSVWRERPYHMSSCWYVAVCVERETLPHVIMLICVCLCGERDLTTCYHVDMWLSVWRERPYHMLSCWYVSVCVERETLPHVIMLICVCLCGERDLTTCHHVDMWLSVWRERPYHMSSCWYVSVCVERETLPHVIMLICGCLCGERDLTTCYHVDMCLSVWRERPYHMSSCWYVSVCVERETLPHVIMLICGCLCGERDLTTCHHVDMCLSVWRERPYHMSSCWYVAVCVERETLPHVIMLICVCLCGERDLTTCYHVDMWLSVWRERPYHMLSCWYVAVCVERETLRETLPHVIMLICGCLCGERDLTTCHHVDMSLMIIKRWSVLQIF